MMGDIWHQQPLTNVADVWFSGVDKKTSPDEVPVRLCNYLDVIRNPIVTSDIDFMRASATAREVERNALKHGDVVFTKDSEVAEEIAEAAYIHEPPEDLVCGYHLAVARPQRNKMDSRFLAASLRLPVIRQQFVRAANGVVRYGLTLQAIQSVSVPCPPLPEQRRIADVLDAWDRAIATTEALIAAKRQFKAALSRRIFSLATPAENVREFDWRTCRIADLADVVGGGTPSTSEPSFWGGEIPWCTPTDLAGLPTRYVIRTERTITAAGLKASSANLLPKNSIVLCSRASVGECAINAVPLSTNQGFQSLVPHNSSDTLFLYYLMRALKRTLLRISAGSTFQEFSRSELRDLEIAVPSSNQRRRIGAAFAQLDDEIDALRAMGERFRLQKRGLMQKLLTGEWRRPGADQATEAMQ